MRRGENRWKYFLKLLFYLLPKYAFLFSLTYLGISAQNSPNLVWAEWGMCSLPRWATEFTLNWWRERGKKQEDKARRCNSFFKWCKPDAANLPLIKQYFTFRNRQLNCTEQFGTIVLPEVAEFSSSEHTKYLLNVANSRSHITTRDKRSLMSVRAEGRSLEEVKESPQVY